MAESTVIRNGNGEGMTLAPDPTELTRTLINREIDQLNELRSVQLDGAMRTVHAELAAIHEAIRVAREEVTRVPTDVEKAVSNLKELHSERFESIEKQFRERDVRVEQTARDTKVAVDAALQAAEKAVGKQNESFALSINKSEAATLKQIDAQSATLTTATASLDGKIGDVKERLTRLESLSIGQGNAVDEQRSSAGEMRGYVATAISVILLAIAIMTFALRLH